MTTEKNAVIIIEKYSTPILAIADYCADNNIPYYIRFLCNGLQICFPWNCGDIVCHDFSYGHEIGEVESYQFEWDNSDVTQLSVKEAITRISDLYKTVTSEKE